MQARHFPSSLAASVGVLLLAPQFLAPARGAQELEKPSRYATSSIGGPQILNPILHADSASGAICGLVFEGLIDRDENLNWRGRLATSWDISEEAYFVVNPSDKRTPQQIAGLIRSKSKLLGNEQTALGRCLRNIRKVEIGPARTLRHQVTEELSSVPGLQHRVNVDVTVRRPPRIKLTLKNIDAGVFTELGAILGANYLSSFKPSERIDVAPAVFAKQKAKYAKLFLPATEHNPVVVFHLRRGVKFHDGHEFDSDDVRFTYESIIDVRNRSPRIPDYEPVKSVETPDKYRVRVVYKRLFSPGFGTWGMQVLPEHLLNEKKMRAEAKAKGIAFEEFNMRKSKFNRHPIGCGPFKFAEWEHNKHVKLRRFDGYWEGPPEFNEYVSQVIPDHQAQKRAFLAGKLDSFSAGPKFSNDERFQRFSGLSYGYTYIGYNMRRKLFQDKRVRRALGMAIDVDAVIKRIVHGQAERITGPFVVQTDFYDKTVRPLPYDPKAAVRLLREAGWRRAENGWLEKNGKRLQFTLITNTGNDVRKAITEAAKESWRKIGVDVSVDMLEWAVFISKHIDQGDFDACILGWSMGIEPDLYQIWHSSQSVPSQLNFCAFKNKQADDLIVRIRQEYDKKKQVQLCHKLHRIIADEQPYTFLFVRRWTALLNKRIVIVRRDEKGKILGYERIKQAKSADYTFDFNRWTKLPELPKSLR